MSLVHRMLSSVSMLMVSLVARYAEMELADKNKISHRYRALEKLRKFLLEQDS